MDSDTKLKRRDDVLHRESDGEAVLLDAERGTYYSLNGPGAAIWDLLENEITIAEIHDRLSGRYDVDSERLMRDLETIVGDMRDNGLLLDPS